MQNRVILVSDDTDFFEYISPQLDLRKSDELFRYGFEDLPEKLDIVETSLVIINSEKAQENTLSLLELLNKATSMVFSYNNDEEFKIKCYNRGCYAYITMMMSSNELKAIVSSGLNHLSKMLKINKYRDILVDNKLLTSNNEVFLKYNKILDKEIDRIKQTASNAVLVAISPNEKSKFLLQPNQIETSILSNVRQNDILMNYAPNKYFLLLNDITTDGAERIWQKILSQIKGGIYAGFAQIGNKNREQLINEVLNKLHEAINLDYINNSQQNNDDSGTNFKIYRKEFNKRVEQTITPVFYHMRQKYEEKLFGMNINHEISDGRGLLRIKSRYSDGVFKVTTPGCSKVNIDITYSSMADTTGKFSFPVSKRITLEPDELEAGILEDILEQFITEFKQEVENEYT